MKAVLRKTVLSILCLAGIVLAAPHQSPTASTAIQFSKDLTCHLANCPNRALIKQPASAFMHESAATLSW